MCYNIDTTDKRHERIARKMNAKFASLEREEARRNKAMLQTLGRTAEAIRAITYATPTAAAAAATVGEFYPTAAERAALSEFVNIHAAEAM